MIGHAVLFFLAGFVQFNVRLNPSGFSNLLFLATPIVGIYFLGWWALLTFVLGGIVGGYLVTMKGNDGLQE